MTAFTSRGRFWVVTVAALLTVALTFSLGQWQLRRAAQKQALQASLDQKSLVAPLNNAELAELANLAALQPQALAALSDRRVDITGQWQAAQTVYLDNRPMNGRPGFWVMTPLQLSGTRQVVLVQRGWIPRDFSDRSRLAPVETSSQQVRLQGRMAPAPGKLYAFKGADTGLIRQNLDIGALAAESGLPLLPVLVLQTGPASEGLQREWAAPNTGIDKHHGYAAQWFGLSALVLGLYVWFQWIVPFRRRSKAL